MSISTPQARNIDAMDWPSFLSAFLSDEMEWKKKWAERIK